MVAMTCAVEFSFLPFPWKRSVMLGLKYSVFRRYLGEVWLIGSMERNLIEELS